MFSGDGGPSRQTRAAMKLLAAIAIATALLCAPTAAAPQRASPPPGAGTHVQPPPTQPVEVPGWTLALQSALEAVDARHPGDIGVYVHHLERDESFSYRAEEPWYLASGIKVPVAIAVLRAVARGELALDTRIELRAEDFVDGAGPTNYRGAGSRLRLDWLLEQMIVHSDNTASDVLIRTVGIDAVNAVAAELTDTAGLHITTLADVRRLAYGQLHPSAARLRSADLLALRRSGAGQARVDKLVQLLQIPPRELRQPDLDSAFEAYYATGANSASLVDFGRMLAALAQGDDFASVEIVVHGEEGPFSRLTWSVADASEQDGGPPLEQREPGEGEDHGGPRADDQPGGDRERSVTFIQAAGVSRPAARHPVGRPAEARSVPVRRAPGAPGWAPGRHGDQRL